MSVCMYVHLVPLYMTKHIVFFYYNIYSEQKVCPFFSDTAHLAREHRPFAAQTATFALDLSGPGPFFSFLFPFPRASEQTPMNGWVRVS